MVTASKSHLSRFFTARPAAVRPLPVGAVAVFAAVLTWLKQGSIAAHDWLPLAVFAALVMATVAAAGVAARPARSVVLGASGLLLLAGWTAISIAWSASPAGARDEALLIALYAVVLVLPALALAGRAEQDRALCLAVGVLALLGTLAAAKLAIASRPGELLFHGRLNFPVSYVNADAAFSMLGFWPATALAARRGASPAGRAAAVGAAALFLALAIAAQSKGALLGLGGSLVVVFALSPSRLRLLVPTLLAAVPAGAAGAALTAPYRSATAAAGQRAGWAALAVLAVGTLLGAAYAATDRRLEVGPARRRLIGLWLAALLAAGTAAALAAFFVTVPAPGTWISGKWTAFKQLPTGPAGASHLTSLGSNRYDFWRVAIDQAAAHPLRGLGGRGFYSAYLEHRRSPETPLRAHSLYLDVLAEGGLPGIALLLLGLLPPLVLLARRLPAPPAVAGLGAGTYFLLHASVDWIWTVPVVGVVAFLLIGIGCAGDPAQRLPRPAAAAVAAAATASAILAFAPPWLAYRYVTVAYLAPSPAADLARARRLDPLSLDPYWAQWRLATTPAGRIAALRAARRLEPRSVAVLYQLGLAYASAGRLGEARTTLLRSIALDPLEPALRRALRAASR